jgi:hypothetical protein
MAAQARGAMLDCNTQHFSLSAPPAPVLPTAGPQRMPRPKVLVWKQMALTRPIAESDRIGILFRALLGPRT